MSHFSPQGQDTPRDWLAVPICMQPLRSRVEMALRVQGRGHTDISPLALERKVSHQWQSVLPRTVPQGLLERAFPGEPASMTTPVPFSRWKHGAHRVPQEGADHLLHSPQHRPDLHHVNSRVPLTLEQPCRGRHGLVTRTLTGL